MKKIVFVDFDGVLSHTPFWDSLRNPNHKLHDYFDAIENFLFKKNSSLVRKWMLGKYSTEEIHKIISKKLNISYSILLKTFKKDCKNTEISKKVLYKLFDIKKTHYLILSTGNMDSFHRFVLPKNKMLTKAFDEIHNSYQLHILKTSKGGKYFKDVIKKQETSFDKCFLLDDSEKTCNLFEKLGGKACCVKKEKQALSFLKSL